MKSYTSLEQSKVLTEILPPETADMRYHTVSHYNTYPCDEIVYTVEFGRVSGKDVPCWSLAALLGALPEIQGCKPIIALDDNYTTYPHITGLHTKADNLIDACYEMVIRLHEQNLL